MYLPSNSEKTRDGLIWGNGNSLTIQSSLVLAFPILSQGLCSWLSEWRAQQVTVKTRDGGGRACVHTRLQFTTFCWAAAQEDWGRWCNREQIPQRTFSTRAGYERILGRMRKTLWYPDASGQVIKLTMLCGLIVAGWKVQTIAGQAPD